MLKFKQKIRNMIVSCFHLLGGGKNKILKIIQRGI